MAKQKCLANHNKAFQKQILNEMQVLLKAYKIYLQFDLLKYRLRPMIKDCKHYNIHLFTANGMGL